MNIKARPEQVMKAQEDFLRRTQYLIELKLRIIQYATPKYLLTNEGAKFLRYDDKTMELLKEIDDQCSIILKQVCIDYKLPLDSFT